MVSLELLFHATPKEPDAAGHGTHTPKWTPENLYKTINLKGKTIKVTSQATKLCSKPGFWNIKEVMPSAETQKGQPLLAHGGF